MGAIRAGLAFQIKDSVGTALIGRRERTLGARVFARLADHPNVHVLGPNTTADRLPVASVLISVQGAGATLARETAGTASAQPARRLFLHQNFVAALLNDLFGVQSRSGCLCAGPYAQRLLGMDAVTVRALESELLRRHELLRPGVTRVSFPYFMADEDADYVVECVSAVGRGASPHP